MSLLDLWRTSRDQLQDKHIQQIVAFAGDGRLRDGQAASVELRAFLGQIPSSLVTRHTGECLSGAFTESGLVLQDLVNEIGQRLGFAVKHGRYRGVSGQVGFDGLWESGDGHSLVVEVKTTDSYRIDLNKVADYRRALVAEGAIADDRSSMLLVVGRQDTGDLEAQIRGSRHGWDIRLISAEALLNLLNVKEELDDPATQNRIHSVLRPREFTKLDEIVDLLFSTTADVKQNQVEAEEAAETAIDESTDKPKFTPVAFHAACVERLEAALEVSLLKKSRASFHAPDDSVRVTCAVSREHLRGGGPAYWFAFHPHHAKYLDEGEKSYAAFGCGSAARLLMIPFSEFKTWIEGMNETTNEERSYKHVSISRNGENLDLVRRRGWPRIDLTKYLVDEEAQAT